MLALVGQGRDFAKGMREVSKTWQAEFELGVLHLKIWEDGPSPPVLLQRFPVLTLLDIGSRHSGSEALGVLEGLPRLHTLVLGQRGHSPKLPFPLREEEPLQPPEQTLAFRLDTLAGVPQLAALRILDLGGCVTINDKALSVLRGMRLEGFVLGPSRRVTDKGLAFALGGMKLLNLSLEKLPKVKQEGINALLLGQTDLHTLKLKEVVNVGPSTMYSLRDSRAPLTDLVRTQILSTTHNISNSRCFAL